MEVHDAARWGQDEFVKSLIKYRADLNIINSLRITFLRRAVPNNWLFPAELLLDSSADPDIHDEDGDTVLTGAIFKKAKAMFDVLLDHGEHGRLKFNLELDFRDE